MLTLKFRFFLTQSYPLLYNAHCLSTSIIQRILQREDHDVPLWFAEYNSKLPDSSSFAWGILVQKYVCTLVIRNSLFQTIP